MVYTKYFAPVRCKQNENFFPRKYRVHSHVRVFEICQYKTKQNEKN